MNLDTLKAEIVEHLTNSGCIVFRGYSRALDQKPEVEWDSAHYPEYKSFVQVGRQLGVKMFVFHHREFSSAVIDRALEDLPASGFEYAEQRQLEQRLRELAMYDGFTCMIELSFEVDGTIYMYEQRTPWYIELNSILDELDLGSDSDGDDEEDETLGGYYSKN